MNFSHHQKIIMSRNISLKNPKNFILKTFRDKKKYGPVYFEFFVNNILFEYSN